MADKGTVNIGGSAHDASYRYKMPKLVAKVEGRGNGIKTRIVNMADIAKSLKCNGSYPTKYFGCELGAQSKWGEATEESIVNGSFTAATLAKLLEGFIDKFILCPQCRLPETDMEVKRETLYANCSACGFYGSIEPGHKLTTYIVKNPPVKRKKVPKAGAPATEKGAPAAKQAAAAAAEEMEDGMFETEPAEVTPKTKADGEDVVWHTDTSDAAVLARQKEGIGANELLNKMSSAHISRHIAETAEEFKAWLNETSRSVDEIMAQMAHLQATYVHPAIQMLDVLIDSLWDNKVVKEFPKYLPLYEKYVDSDKAQKVVLGNIERFFGETHQDMKKFAPHLLKAFYDADLLEEATILKWAEKKGSKYVDSAGEKSVKAACKQFTDWLKEAEEGSDEEGSNEKGSEAEEEAEDEEESEEEAPKKGKGAAKAPAPATAKKPAASPAPAKGAAKPSAEEDIDIDDI